ARQVPHPARRIAAAIAVHDAVEPRRPHGRVLRARDELKTDSARLERLLMDDERDARPAEDEAHIGGQIHPARLEGWPHLERPLEARLGVAGHTSAEGR